MLTVAAVPVIVALMARGCSPLRRAGSRHRTAGRARALSSSTTTRATSGRVKAEPFKGRGAGLLRPPFACANFREPPQRELPRTTIPRTRVNKGVIRKPRDNV